MLKRVALFRALETHPFYASYLKKLPKSVQDEIADFLRTHAETPADDYARMVLRMEYPSQLKPKKNAMLVNEILLVCK